MLMTFDIDASSSLGLEIKVVVEATGAIGGADPEAQDEGGALLEHGGEVQDCHRVHNEIIGELSYLEHRLWCFTGKPN